MSTFFPCSIFVSKSFLFCLSSDQNIWNSKFILNSRHKSFWDLFWDKFCFEFFSWNNFKLLQRHEKLDESKWWHKEADFLICYLKASGKYLCLKQIETRRWSGFEIFLSFDYRLDACECAEVCFKSDVENQGNYFARGCKCISQFHFISCAFFLQNFGPKNYKAVLCAWKFFGAKISA